MRKKREPIPYIEVLRRLTHAGVYGSPPPNRPTGKQDDVPSLKERVDFLMGIVNQPKNNATDMLFFVMYDIESNKVRREIAKYLGQGVLSNTKKHLPRTIGPIHIRADKTRPNRGAGPL